MDHEFCILEEFNFIEWKQYYSSILVNYILNQTLLIIQWFSYYFYQFFDAVIAFLLRLEVPDVGDGWWMWLSRLLLNQKNEIPFKTNFF